MSLLRAALNLSADGLHLGAACGLGLLLGAASLLLSPLLVLAALVGGFALVLALKRPEIALLGIVSATSTIVFADSIPLVKIGIGSLTIVDMALLGMLGLIALRWLAEPGFGLVHTPLDLPLLLFYGFSILATAVAIMQSSLEFRVAIKEVRVISYYLMFFIATNLLREERQRRFLLNGLLLLASGVALVMLAQYVVGPALNLLPGRVENLNTQGVSYTAITRILPPGQSLVVMAFIYLTIALVLEDFRAHQGLRFGQWGLLGMGVLLTFNRSYWIGIGLTLVFLACLSRGQDRRRLVVWGLIVVSVAAVLFASAALEPTLPFAPLLHASAVRLGTVVSGSAIEESSLQFRVIEDRYALAHLSPPPLLGLGLGAQYRPFTELDWEQYDGRAYIHNGHLWILLKSGLLAYLALLALALRFLWRGFKHWRHLPDAQGRAGVLAFSLTYLVVLLGSITSPMLMEWFWIAPIGLMMGLNEGAIRAIPPGAASSSANKVLLEAA